MFRSLLTILFGFLIIGMSYSQQDSSKTNGPKWKEVMESGNISLGYEYGLLPFLVNVDPPQGNFKTQGNVALNVFKVPLNVNFYYSNLGTITGLNNYFTVRFDAQRFQRNMLEKSQQEKQKRLSMLDSLQFENQELLKRRSYLSLLKAGKIAFPVDSSLYEIPTYEIDSQTLDTLNVNMSYEIPDFSWNDSLEDVYQTVNQDLGGITDSIQRLRSLLNVNTDSLLALGETPPLPEFESRSKLQQVLTKIQKFEVGMCYPNYSEFLVSRIPVRGVNVEVQNKKFFGAFTHGKTVNNIFLTNNLVNNNLNAARNLYNFFNFNNIEDGRKITAFKVGYGARKDNHLHIGMLYGLGKASYLDTTSVLTDIERNLVAEVDGRFKIGSHSIFDAAYGRSAIQVNNINYEEQSNLFESLVDMNERTNAFLGKYTFNLSKTGTKVQSSFRWVDPFYRSFGVGFIRSDNIRYQVKVSQKLGKKLTVGGLFRKEEDNLLKIYDYKNVLFSYGANIAYRPNRHWMMKVDYRPIAQNIESSIDSLNNYINNWIVNGVVNYNRRIGETHLNFSNIYSHYQLFNGEANNSYVNFNSNLSLSSKNGWNETLSFNYFTTTDTVSTPQVTILQNDFSIERPSGFTLTLMAKASLSEAYGFQPGYGLRTIIPIYKVVSFEASGERLVLGDFYNSILQSGYDEFPYYFNAAILIRW